MATNGISNVFLTQQTLRLIGQGQSSLSTLQQQLSTGLKTSDLSELGTTQSRRLLDLRGSEASRKSYTEVINIVTPRVETQNNILDNFQKLIAQIGQAINVAPTYEGAQQTGVSQQVTDALRQIGAYLNEKIDDRYLFSGARYNTLPVRDLTALPSPPTEAYPFTPASAPVLPAYDTNYAGPLTVDEAAVTSVAADDASDTFTLGSGNWAALGYKVGDQVTFGGLSVGGNNATFTITNLSGANAVVTPSPSDMVADNTLTMTRTPSVTSPDSLAWVTDSTAIDDGLTVPYGITSTNPGFQKMIMGMRWAFAATQDQANYTTYMQRATDLLAEAKIDVRGVEAANTANYTLLQKTKEQHTTYINQLVTGQQNIQGVDRNEVAARVTLLQSQIEASYAVTARISQLSLINYL